MNTIFKKPSQLKMPARSQSPYFKYGDCDRANIKCSYSLHFDDSPPFRQGRVKFRKHLYAFNTLFSIFVLCVVMVACDEEEEFQKTVKRIEKLKIEAEVRIEKVPYRVEEHSIFRNYFSQINEWIVSLWDDTDSLESFHEWAEDKNISLLCSALLSKEKWITLKEHCTHNTFFLCAEEVKSYPETVLALKSLLEKETQRIFDQNPNCPKFY